MGEGERARRAVGEGERECRAVGEGERECRAAVTDAVGGGGARPRADGACESDGASDGARAIGGGGAGAAVAAAGAGAAAGSSPLKLAGGGSRPAAPLPPGCLAPLPPPPKGSDAVSFHLGRRASAPARSAPAAAPPPPSASRSSSSSEGSGRPPGRARTGLSKRSTVASRERSWWLALSSRFSATRERVRMSKLLCPDARSRMAAKYRIAAHTLMKPKNMMPPAGVFSWHKSHRPPKHLLQSFAASPPALALPPPGAAYADALASPGSARQPAAPAEGCSNETLKDGAVEHAASACPVTLIKTACALTLKNGNGNAALSEGTQPPRSEGTDAAGRHDTQPPTCSELLPPPLHK